jgi:hypothetical protein
MDFNLSFKACTGGPEPGFGGTTGTRLTGTLAVMEHYEMNLELRGGFFQAWLLVTSVKAVRPPK